MTAQFQTGAPPAPPLPRLRSDLKVDLVPEEAGGFPAAVVSDPVRGCYFRLAWPESGIFLEWQQTQSLAVLHLRLRQQYGALATPETVAEVVEFGLANQLTVSDKDGTWHRYASLMAAGKQGWLATIMHSYLFFRIPLVRPEPWLRAILPWLSIVYRRWFWTGVAGLALAAFYLAARQWADVSAAASSVLQLESVGLYILALLGLKAVHELGHALTTVRYGCRVPSMGLAIMLGAPLLYTDTSDSWRLSRRSERLAIVFAGVAAESIVATAALLAWCFLPDGTLRSICFAISTTSIALSLLVNLNPLMRFDGYFALSDYLGVPNLQARSFALLSWKLREILFDLGHEPPEKLGGRMRRTLIRYAAATAIYRLFLYLAIAAVVYVVAGKALGIVLAAFEIVVFILNPLASEIMTWWKLRAEIAKRRRPLWTAAVASAALAALCAPWLSTVEAPAMLVAEREEAIYLPFPARLTAINVREGQLVRAGDILFAADAADLERREIKARLEQRALQVKVSRVHANEKEREQRRVIESEFARSREEVAAIRRQKQQLVVRAPFDGRIADLDPQISNGLWLDEKQPLAHLVAVEGARARGMIAETDIRRIASGARAVFIPDDAAQRRQPLVVASLAPASNGRFAEPALADLHGGRVVSAEQQGELMARHGMFEVTFESFDRPATQVVRGLARIEAEPISPGELLWRAIARVLVREQGF